jgi:CO/xanthine dehydrogenase Mo-binding subunit
VEIKSTRTGQIKVLDAAVAFQVGQAINLLTMEGQMEGGVGMGVGYALLEEYITGKTKDGKTIDCLGLRCAADISTYVVEIPQGPGPFGLLDG